MRLTLLSCIIAPFMLIHQGVLAADSTDVRMPAVINSQVLVPYIDKTNCDYPNTDANIFTACLNNATKECTIGNSNLNQVVNCKPGMVLTDLIPYAIVKPPAGVTVTYIELHLLGRCCPIRYRWQSPPNCTASQPAECIG